MVAAVRGAKQAPGYPAVLLFSLAPLADNREFFQKRGPELRVVADPQKEFYGAFGLAHGTLGDFAGPRAVVAAIGGLLRGHGVGRPKGDPLVMPGVFVVRGGEVLWQHEFAHAGDNPDFAAVPRHAGLA